jgi:SAM-dependent methyltransferase
MPTSPEPDNGTLDGKESQMSAFSDLDASSNATALFAYLDATDRSLTAMKSYIAATAARRAAGGRVLDLGCGLGHDLQRLAAVGTHPVGLDVSAQALARAATHGYPVVRADAGALPFATDSFAGCRIERVLQHVDDPGRILNEVVRVVRPDGVVAVFEPDWTSFRIGSEVVADGSLPARFVAARHPDIGARVAELLRARGCTVLDVTVETSFGYGLDALPLDAEVVTQRGVDAGLLDPALREQWLDEQKQRERAGIFDASWSKILTVAAVAAG